MRGALIAGALAALGLPAVGQIGSGAARHWPQARIAPGSCDLPEAARGASRSGLVVLRYQLSDQLLPASVTVARSSGDASLDDALVERLKTCRFVLPTGTSASADGVSGAIWIPLGQVAPAAGPASAAPQGGRASIVDVRRCVPVASDYSVEARRKNLQGTTKVRFSVADTGLLLQAELSASSGAGMLDEAALARLMTCQFRPGLTADGHRVGGSFEVEYVWRLDD